MRFTSSACSVCEMYTVCLKEAPGSSVRTSLTFPPWIQLTLTVRVCALRIVSSTCERPRSVGAGACVAGVGQVGRASERAWSIDHTQSCRGHVVKSSDAGEGRNYPCRSPGRSGPATCSFAGSSVEAMRF